MAVFEDVLLVGLSMSDGGVIVVAFVEGGELWLLDRVGSGVQILATVSTTRMIRTGCTGLLLPDAFQNGRSLCPSLHMLRCLGLPGAREEHLIRGIVLIKELSGRSELIHCFRLKT